MDIAGIIYKIEPTQSYGANNFLKRNVVISTTEQYSQKILIEFLQDKTNLVDNFQVGEEVTISVNIRGREWINPQGEAKYFNSINGWRIVGVGQRQQAQTQQRQPAPQSNFPNDDLPF